MAEGGNSLDAVRSSRAEYKRRLLEIRGTFEAGQAASAVAPIALRARSEAVDALVTSLWQLEPIAEQGTISVVAVGGYGRRELFPSSDVDLLFLLESKATERDSKDAIRRVCQAIWDAGARAAPVTRALAECERLDPDNLESTLALLDARRVCGDAGLFRRFELAQEKLVAKDGKTITSMLGELARMRYGKYGGTLFHLEPNVKDCPGGLRDVHLCRWMARLEAVTHKGAKEEERADFGNEFKEAFAFLATVRCFLHYRRERDDNTLDWQAQDEAAALSIAAGADGVRGDASYWMRVYFRHARVVNRRALQALSEVPAPRGLRMPRLRRRGTEATEGFRVEHGRATLLKAREGSNDPAREPDVVLGLFVAMAESGFVLARETEDRLTQALPYLSTHLEEGSKLWQRLRAILTGSFAGEALRAMHALGLLELLIPEFHGIDALVVRDAYHRYTVDEHTFVLIDTLHGLAPALVGAPADWGATFAKLLGDLQHPELLYLAALLHDTGKGRMVGLHAVESERMARSVLKRLELDAYEAEQVAGLVRHHLEMSATLRRDIFDAETVRGFAAKVPTPEMLRMLTLFTYADINAVHPDALTPWKAENLWRLYMAASNCLDRSVDEDRVSTSSGGELVHRMVAFSPARKVEVEQFLEGFPERYLRTRTSEEVLRHFEMAGRIQAERVQLDLAYRPEASRLTLVTRDGERLFATVAGVLSAWGMNIVTADGFSNAAGVVVDSFRFTDSFRTLEMNVTERDAFVESMRGVLMGEQSLDRLLAGRRRGRRKTPKVAITATVEFDPEASSQSTLMQVVAQDTPGLLRALSLTIASHGCNVEVALVDTEGEMAIDVFYLRRGGQKLEAAERERLREDLLAAIEANAR